MRILLISLLFLLVGCASYPSKNGFIPALTVEENTIDLQGEKINLYFSDLTKDYVYKAQIEAFGNSFSGILAIKKMGEAHHRLAFTTEMGNTIFDFTFQEDTFKVNSILSKLDRKIIIGILKRDFLALITENPEIEKTFEKEGEILQKSSVLGKKHYYLSKNGRLSKITRAKNGTEKVVFEFRQPSENVAEVISIVHKNIKLTIHLNAL